jgi:hypothetical protein
LGVPLVSMGGWLWIGIGLAAAAVGLALALVDRWSFAARLGFSLTTSALVWTAVLVALVIDPKLLWPPPRVPASAWRVFQPNNLPCRLEMPGRPQERRPQGFQGEALAHWWQVVHQDVGEFVLSHTRVDPIAGPPDPKVLLDEARDGVVATTAGGRLVSEKALTLDGHPGRECLLEMEGGRNLTVRMYLAGHHLFILLAGAGRLPPDAPDIRRFLESFTLVGLDAP